MIQLPSALEGKTFNLHDLEQQLKPLGYSIGGNWDYDSGSFDYKIDDEEGYQFLRLPFTAVDGQLDSPGVIVQFGSPFVLAHVYQGGIDDVASSGNISGAFNQFAEPEDPDAQVKEEYVASGKRLLEEVERTLNV
ncbi:YugN-like family protein [Bacillus sp. B190/17]|uniref:YugN-like family protein n=1 Tax=Bacillus lumedeiriae TaxID=3058829 RepID=A0ABW8ICM7_9BACI